MLEGLDNIITSRKKCILVEDDIRCQILNNYMLSIIKYWKIKFSVIYCISEILYVNVFGENIFMK